MGLFSKRHHEPIVHPAAERVVYVEASRGEVATRLDAYSGLSSPKHATEQTLHVATSGSWTAVRLPERIHPWQLHNLACWMLELPGRVIATASACEHHPAYWVGADPELPDTLCGWDEQGTGWTVWVPTNVVSRGDQVPVERAIAVPAGFHDWAPHIVRMEDPGHDMNPTNASMMPRSRIATGDEFTGMTVWAD